MDLILGPDGRQAKLGIHAQTVKDIESSLDIGIGVSGFQGGNGRHAITQFTSQNKLGHLPSLPLFPDQVAYPGFFLAGRGTGFDRPGTRHRVTSSMGGRALLPEIIA
jgi:hypothetical protein